MVAPGTVFAASHARRNFAVTPVVATWLRFGPKVPPQVPTVWQLRPDDLVREDQEGRDKEDVGGPEPSRG